MGTENDTSANKVTSDNDDAVKTPKKQPAKTYKHPEFIDMVNPKGVVVEIHKDRVAELSKAGYKLSK